MADVVADVRAALNQTVAARTARIQCSTTFSWAMPTVPSRERGPIQSVLVKTGKTVGRAVGGRLLRLVTGHQDLRHHSSEGVIDFAGRRFMLDHGSYARLQLGTQAWSGRSGRPRNTLPTEPARVASPLWLVDLLAATSTASVEGVDEIEHERWRRVAITADLAKASAACPGGMPSPAENRFENLLELPVEVWLDDSHVRQIRFATEHETTVMTMTDFGTDVDHYDWGRLPTFRSA